MATKSSKKSYCVYCGDVATTRDHIPPKSILERPYPNNLRTVPCCKNCNLGFSLDEQYFLVLLAQTSTSPALTSRLETGGSIDRALYRAPALEEKFISSLEPDEDGRILIRPELDRVKRVIKKIGLGLFVIRYNRFPTFESLTQVGAYPYNISDERPLPYFIATFTERFRRKQWRNVQPKVFSYIFVRDPKSSSRVWCVMDFHQTLWGVVYCPNPQSVKVCSEKQLWLFPEKSAG